MYVVHDQFKLWLFLLTLFVFVYTNSTQSILHFELLNILLVIFIWYKLIFIYVCKFLNFSDFFLLYFVHVLD